MVGVSTSSLAILGDAIHSLTDLFNNIVAWTVVKYSCKPPDRKHPYGHRKFETLAVFGLAALLTILSFELALHAIQRQQVVVTQDFFSSTMMAMVLLVNIAIATWQARWARKLRSDILLADANHTFADVLTTLIVIAGWQLSARGYAWLDTIGAIGVAILVLLLALGLFRRSIPILVDSSAIEPDKMYASIQSIDGVKNIKRLRSRKIGAVLYVDMIITVDATLSTKESHEIANQVESLLEHDYKVNDITIHIEPNLLN